MFQNTSLLCLVSLAGALRDDTKNGCEGDYVVFGSQNIEPFKTF